MLTLTLMLMLMLALTSPSCYNQNGFTQLILYVCVETVLQLTACTRV